MVAMDVVAVAVEAVVEDNSRAAIRWVALAVGAVEEAVVEPVALVVLAVAVRMPYFYLQTVHRVIS
jgi:hypothetical protein